jgi:two-component system chemotaxis response regulator CheY
MARETGSSILVVDDSATMRAILKDMLARLNYRSVDEADSGAAALELIKSKRYNLIISDWHMEPMSGPQLLKAIVPLRTGSSYRFIFATTDKTWGSQATARMAGADAFVVKPFTISALKAKIDEVLGRP